jgi:probable F420-dependent oxidoreductase
VHPFRFGFQASELHFDEIPSHARDIEDLGFDVMHTWDHVDSGPAPLAPLVAIAQATTRLRVCPLVLNNDFHHPVHLARELATIDHLSGGRLEIGIGAGHSLNEYEAIGVPFYTPAIRKARMGEAVEILRSLLEGDEVVFRGEYYRIDGVKTMRSRQTHVPLLVGVNGRRALSHAALHADIIGLTMLGRTLGDGNRHEVKWQEKRLDDTVAYLRQEAGSGWARLELNVLVQAVVVTNNRRRAAEEIAARIPGLSVDDALVTPFLALGTCAEIAEHLVACRERWGVSYFSVRDYAAFGPVIERLR